MVFFQDQHSKWTIGFSPFNQTLDWFDPFDELDHMIGRNMEWLQRPAFMEPLPLKPKVPHKYRITVDCAGT